MDNTIIMKCPICGQQVTKIADTDKEPKGERKCESEYYLHVDDKLIKFKHPKHNYYGEGK